MSDQLARCLPVCNAPLRLDIEPALLLTLGKQWGQPEATLRPERIVLRCSHCGRLREHHRVLDEQESEI